MIERHVEVPVIVERRVTVSPRGSPGLAVLDDLTRQLDTDRRYARDPPAVSTAINAVCAAAGRRLRR